MGMDNDNDDGDDDDDDNDTDNDSDDDNDNDSDYDYDYDDKDDNDYDYDCDYDDIKHLFAYFRIETSTEVNLLKLPALGPAANQRSSIGPAANQRGPTGPAANQRGPTAQFTQWSLFGPCSRTCGKSFQSRARRCLARYAFVCKGTTVESRECYMRPCPGEQLQE